MNMCIFTIENSELRKINNIVGTKGALLCIMPGYDSFWGHHSVKGELMCLLKELTNIFLKKYAAAGRKLKKKRCPSMP